ncbi:AzlC family ABC transporter permease [Undibacterium sp. Ren11W]|uniref:AzlC family ABC transporter permease n=1 Tax=Undibacterium sp. Ren11W TaxID=3413045 RepID=UPI003BF414B9
MTTEIDKAAFQEGYKIGMPTWFGVAAWGLVVGVAMIKAGLSMPQALGMTLIVFAGSAQLASLPLIAAHAPLWLIFTTALVVNLRFVIFSAILAPHFSYLPWRTKAVMGYLTGDISVALFMQKYPEFVQTHGKLAYLKGLVYPNWCSWQIGSIIGILLGSQIPASWGLGFAGTLAILCVMLPAIVSRAAVVGVLVAGAVAVLAANMPYKLGLLVAVVMGMAAAMLLEEWLEKKQPTPADTNAAVLDDEKNDGRGAGHD